jgi:polyisoprenoid-binding protein YceI
MVRTIILTTALALNAAFAMDAVNVMHKANLDKSSVSWHATKVTGEHWGTIGIKDSWIELAGDKITGGMFVFDMDDIIVTDIESPEWNAKLVNHLKSDDFFSVEKFPEVRFELTSAEQLKHKNHSEPNYQINGKLTIKGITHDVSLPAHIHLFAKGGNAKGEIVLDRTLWDIRYGSGKFFEGLGDKTIHDEFKVSFDVMTSVVKKSAEIKDS